MANVTLSVANTGGFIPTIWAQEALNVLRAYIRLAKLISRDSDYEAGWLGQTLNIPYPGTFTAQDKAANTVATLQTPSGGATIPVTLNKHKTVDFIVEDFANAQANMNLMLRYVQPAAIALAEAVENDIFALYSSMTQTVGTSGTDLTAATLRSAKKKMDDNKIPSGPRAAVISTKDEIALMGDSSLQQYFAYARPEVIQNGGIGTLYGFDIYPSQLVPVVAGTPNSTKNLFFHPQQMILATRPFRDPPQNSGVQTASIQDEESGLVLRIMYQYSMDYRGVHVGLDILYGTALVRDVAGLIALS